MIITILLFLLSFKTEAASPFAASVAPGTQVLIQLDSIHRYYFPIATNPHGISKEKLELLLSQGEFGVIEQRLVLQHGEKGAEVVRYKSCLKYESQQQARTQDVHGSIDKKRAFSLEAVATLCLASTGDRIAGYGLNHVHVQKSDDSPERIALLSSNGKVNPFFENSLPPINSDGKTPPTRALVNSHISAKGREAICALSANDVFCRSCSRFDTGKIKYVNTPGNASKLTSQISEEGRKLLQQEKFTLNLGAAISPDRLLKLQKEYSPFDLSQIKFYTRPSSIEGLQEKDVCVPCPVGGTVDNNGRCMVDECDFGLSFDNGPCKKSCEDPHTIRMDGICHVNCSKDCNERIRIWNFKINKFKNYNAPFTGRKEILIEKIQMVEGVIKTYQNDVQRCEKNERTLLCQEGLDIGKLFYELEMMIPSIEKCPVGEEYLHDNCVPAKCASCFKDIDLDSLPSTIGSCGDAELTTVHQRLENRWIRNSDLLQAQCLATGNMSVIDACINLTNPTPNDAVVALRELGINCYPETKATNAPATQE